MVYGRLLQYALQTAYLAEVTRLQNVTSIILHIVFHEGKGFQVLQQTL